MVFNIDFACVQVVVQTMDVRKGRRMGAGKLRLISKCCVGDCVVYPGVCPITPQVKVLSLVDFGVGKY